MSGHSAEKDLAIEDALRSVGYLEYIKNGEDPEWAVLVSDAVPALRKLLIAAWSEGFRAGRNADHNPCWWPKNPYRETSPTPPGGSNA